MVRASLSDKIRHEQPQRASCAKFSRLSFAAEGRAGAKALGQEASVAGPGEQGPQGNRGRPSRWAEAASTRPCRSPKRGWVLLKVQWEAIGVF